MKVCGIPLWRIARRPLLLASLFTVVCLYVNNEMAPRSHYAQRSIASRLTRQSPLELLEEGRFIQEFNGLTIYIGERRGRKLTDVRIGDLRDKGLRREIRAASGIVRHNTNGPDLLLDLYDVRIDPFYEDGESGFCAKWPVVIKNAFMLRKRRKGEKDMTVSELLAGIRDVKAVSPNLFGKDLKSQRSVFLVELNKRLTLSASCLAFVLLGIPLGIKAHRKESSIGIAISLFLVFNFYLFIIIGESLATRPELFPALITWLPVFISIGLGSILLQRIN